MRLPEAPEQLVFSGGGLRCFWQGGVLSVLDDALDWQPRRITGVSGGALASVAHIAGCGTELLETMCEVFAAQDSNLDLFAAGDDGITPHQRLYCDVVEDVIDARARQAVIDGPALQILLAHPPDTPVPDTLTGAAMALAYEAELHLIGSPHFNWAEKMGLTAQLVDARQAARDGKLIDLICAAAVIPPVFTPPLWDGRSVVDGGMADQAPMPEPDSGETVVLLTRRYSGLPEIAGRHYFWPSEQTQADKIDFTDPRKLRDTWSQGQRDAQAWLDGTEAT